MEFEAFVAARSRALLHHAWTLTGDWHLAEDLLQDVLVKAHKHWRRITSTASPEAYLRSMIVNKFVSERRLLRNRERPAPQEQFPDAQQMAPDLEQRDAFLGALRELTRSQRVVMVLRYYEDWTDEQIANELGCSASTVRSHAEKAKQKLAKVLTLRESIK